MHVELATHATIVLVLGIRQPVTALDRFAHDLAAELELIRRPGAASAILQPAAAMRPDVVVAPREAFLGDAERLEVDAAVGRVSAEAIAGYPPGIPALLPGERITAEVVEYLRELATGRRPAARRKRSRVRHDHGPARRLTGSTAGRTVLV